MEKWEYQVVLVNKWGRAMKRQAGAPAGAWHFEESKSADLLDLLAELGNDGWDLIAVDTNKSYAEGSYSYVGSLYIFQRRGQ